MKADTVYVFVGKMENIETGRVFRSYVAVSVPCNERGDPEDDTENPAWRKALDYFLEYADDGMIAFHGMKLWHMVSIVAVDDARPIS